MNERRKAFLNLIISISVILGVLLLVVAGLLLFKPELFFIIVKTALIVICAGGGISFLLTALVLGIVSVKSSGCNTRNEKTSNYQ